MSRRLIAAARNISGTDLGFAFVLLQLIGKLTSNIGIVSIGLKLIKGGKFIKHLSPDYV